MQRGNKRTARPHSRRLPSTLDDLINWSVGWLRWNYSAGDEPDIGAYMRAVRMEFGVYDSFTDADYEQAFMAAKIEWYGRTPRHSHRTIQDDARAEVQMWMADSMRLEPLDVPVSPQALCDAAWNWFGPSFLEEAGVTYADCLAYATQELGKAAAADTMSQLTDPGRTVRGRGRSWSPEYFDDIRNIMDVYLEEVNANAGAEELIRAVKDQYPDVTRRWTDQELFDAAQSTLSDKMSLNAFNYSASNPTQPQVANAMLRMLQSNRTLPITGMVEQAASRLRELNQEPDLDQLQEIAEDTHALYFGNRVLAS